MPISISVLGGKELDSSTFSGVTEALNTVPGVAAVANQVEYGGTLLEMRGVAAGAGIGAGASPIAYYVDSVPFGQINAAVMPDPNVYDLQQIEVLRGPQGTLYGANALNGVVRVLTHDPDLNNFDFKMRGVISATEYGGENYDGDMTVNIPIIDGVLAARATVGDDHESGWINGPLGTHLNEGDLSNVRLKVNAQLTESLSVGVSAWHSQQNYANPSVGDSNRDVSNLHPEPFSTEFNAYGVKVDYELPLASISSMSSYIDYNNRGTLDLSGLGSPLIIDSELPSRVYSEEVNLSSKNTGPWRWSAGAMYRDDKDGNSLLNVFYSGVTATSVPTSYVPFDNLFYTSRSEAVYGELGRRFLNDELQWTVGLRYFHDNEGTQANGPIPGLTVPVGVVTATSSATTPRAVLTWFPGKNLTAYATFSQGFRSGAPQDELVGAIVPDFPAVKPDKLTNYELGVKGSFLDQRVSYDAAVFYINWRDIQQALDVPNPVGGSGTYIAVLVNGGTASGEGAEFSLKMEPVEGLLVGADFGWNNLHFDSNIYSGGAVLFPEGSRPNFSPEYTAGLSTQYSFPLGANGLKGVIAASGNYISPLNTTYLTAGTVQANSALLTRGNIGIEFSDHWTIAVFVDNANNYSGTQTPTLGAPQFDVRLRPRTYGLRFDYHLR